MALVTRNQRAAALGITLPWNTVNTLPAPDGQVDQDEQPAVIWMVWFGLFPPPSTATDT